MEKKRIVIYSLVLVLALFTGYSLSGHYIDSSQTVQEASNNGAPSDEKIWTSNEHQMFYDYLYKLSDEVDYPMLSSEKSGSLFKKFIDSLALDTQEVATNNALLMETMRAKNIVQNVLSLYVEKDIKVQKYTDEIAHLYGMEIKLTLDTQKAAEKVINAIDKNDDSYKLRLKGIGLMKQSAAVQISVSLDLIVEEGSLQYSPILMSYIENYVPSLLGYFSEDGNKLLTKRILDTAEKTGNESVKSSLKEIAATI